MSTEYLRSSALDLIKSLNLTSELKKYKLKIRPIDGVKLVFGASTIYLFYKTVQLYIKRRKYRHIPGPKTNGIYGFFFGNLDDVKKWAATGASVRMQYGEVFKFQLFNRMFVCTSDKQAIKEILVTKDLPKNEIGLKLIKYPFNIRFLGEGLVTDSDYQRWRHRRALFNPGFHRQVLLTFVTQFNTKVDNLLEHLRTKADGKTLVKLLPELNHLTLDAIAQIAFGMNLDSINENENKFNSSITGIFNIIQQIFRDPFFKLRPSNFEKIRNCKNMIKFLRESGREVIIERINSFKNHDYLPTDILSNILESWKDDDLDIESMIDDFITFFIAGQETTANTLSFCFLELGRNPQVLEKMLKEIDSVLGERTQVTFQDISELKYCACVFKEALRLYPPVASMARFNPEPIEINGYIIPENTTISVSSYLCGRLEKYFPNPLEFKPERFLKDKDSFDSSIESYTYFPFSLGPRNCIGQNFAQIEGIITLAKFLQRMDLKLDPTQSFKIKQQLTICPVDQTRVYLTIRS